MAWWKDGIVEGQSRKDKKGRKIKEGMRQFYEGRTEGWKDGRTEELKNGNERTKGVEKREQKDNIIYMCVMYTYMYVYTYIYIYIYTHIYNI
jgi:hypothetical protein